MPEVLQPGGHAPCLGARRQCALLADQAQRNAGAGAGEGVNRIDLFAVLQVVHRAITHCLLDQAGPKADEADSGAAMLIQPSWWLNGSAANLNIHLHCLVLDSVYRYDTEGAPVFVEVPVPTDEALQAVLHKIITRLMKLLTRKGCLGKVGQTTMADDDSDSDSDSDEARVRRLLQAASWPCRPRRAKLLKRVLAATQLEYKSVFAAASASAARRAGRRRALSSIRRPVACLAGVARRAGRAAAGDRGLRSPARPAGSAAARRTRLRG